MLFALALIGLAAPLVSAVPAAVTAAISPSAPAPSGCLYSYPGYFNFAKAENAPPGKVKRQDPNNKVVLTLMNGLMQDSDGFTAYVASNGQFQFDKPPQAGAIYTAGFSICPNMTIALGGTADWFQCSNGSGALNIYYKETTGLKCTPIFLEAIPVGSGSPIPATTPPATSAPATSAPASTPASTAPPSSTPASTPAVTPPAVATSLPDGQPQVPTTAAVVTSIPDHQPQAPSTYVPITSIVDHQPQVGTGVPAPPPVATPPPYTGGAFKAKAEIAAVAAGALAIAIL